MKKWQVESKEEISLEKELIDVLLKNRFVKSKKEIDEFLNPRVSDITISSVKINKSQLEKSLKRIKTAISKKQKIIIYGDYDVDGICASAILWETLNNLKADVLPYIPSRFEEGYGLSKQGIDNLLKNGKVDLIITVDNGIVANEAVLYAKKLGIDVIITDHHLPSKLLPKAFSIVHTTMLCGTGVSYLLSKKIKNEKLNENDSHLELVALATIADLVPLKSANRTLVYFGIKALQKTKRVGLLALFQKTGVEKKEIGVYEIGYILAPRINAMGRLENAIDSLRLLCTTNKKRAQELSELLSSTNTQRQQLTIGSLEHAKSKVSKKENKKLIFISDESYNEGIVGLIAGRLAEEYYLPSVVISKGEKISKASARSVKGFNIVEFLREASDLMVDIGGHPMAAGFSIKTENIDALEKKLLKMSEKLIKKEHLERILRIDAQISQSLIKPETYSQIQRLSPFGMANPEPTFLTKDMAIENLRLVGNDGKHLKIIFTIDHLPYTIQGIYFGGGISNGFKIGDRVDVVYSLDENIWNGNKTLQLKIKDIKNN